MIFWNLESEQIDFTGGEFDELVAHLRTGGLFAYLERHRPALLAQLLSMFQHTMDEMELEPGDVEQALETRLMDLHRQLRP